MTKARNFAVLTALAAGAAITLTATFAYADGGRGHQRGMNFEQTDANSDGFITTAEIEAARKVRFDERDTNKDGFLTKDELSAHMQSKAAEHGKDIDAAKMEKRLDRMFDRADANDDGKIAFSEMPQRDASKLMERVDTDKDGKISKAEAEAVKGKWGKRKGGKNKG